MMKSFTLESDSLMSNNVWNLSENFADMQVVNNANNDLLGIVPPVPCVTLSVDVSVNKTKMFPR